tara:strand:+ start:3823 stop:8139 length:4317 start_codon:yes stop_codon:yes gene_type:complete
VKNNICYFVHTCDDYSKFWDGWFDSFQKFWPKDLDWNVYFVNETDEISFSDDRIKQLKTFKTKKEYIKEERQFDTQGNPFPGYGGMKQFDYGWTDRLLNALDQIEEEYLLWVQEDMWLKTNVDSNLFENAYRFVERNDFNVLRMHRINSMSSPYPDHYTETDLFINDYRLIKINKNAGYLMSHQPSIWKKSFLKEIQIPGESFRDNEFEGTERIRKYDDPKIYHLLYDWCHGVPGAATQGNFHTYSYEQEAIEHKNDLKMYDDYHIKRSKYTYSEDELKLSLVTSCYNAENYIDELANSVITQNYQNWEWIIADDFSTDETLQKLNKIQSLDNRIKIVYPKFKKEIWWNPQIHATGDIVCHLDSDDKLLPNCFDMINYYFKTFPEAVLLHFNANKYHGSLPNSHENITENFKDNVYISKDNDSFLEGFERLWYWRSGIFGYLRIFRNLPGLKFPVHKDGDACSSNDGQWLLMLEERGKWLTIPRTVYLAREHGDSENFRNWNARGEAQLAIDARKRRKNIVLDYPRNLKYFDDIYHFAESVYISTLNWSQVPQKVSFLNYNQTSEQENKVKKLFFDHDVNFNLYLNEIDYYFIFIDLDTDSDKINYILEKIKSSKKENTELIFFCDNVNLQKNNRTGEDFLESIRKTIENQGIKFYFYDQFNRHYILNLKNKFDSVQNNEKKSDQNIQLLEHIEEKKKEIEKIYDTKERLKVLQILFGFAIEVPPKGYGGLEEVMYHYSRIGKSRNHIMDFKFLRDVTQRDIEYYDVIHIHSGNFGKDMYDRNIPYIFTLHDTWAKANGRDNHYYKENINCIDKSLFSMIPSSDMKEFFVEQKDKLIHVDHGVDTNFFYPMVEKDLSQFKIICVGGGFDRKGFHLAIEVANDLNLPITIVGPEPREDPANFLTYEIYDATKHKNDIKIVGELYKNDLRNALNEHHILIHASSLESGQPCLAVLEAMSCGLPCVGVMHDNIEVPGFYKCERDINSIKDGVIELMNNYEYYSSDARNFALSRDWEIMFNKMEDLYYRAKEMKIDFPINMKERLVENYERDTNKMITFAGEIIDNSINVDFKEFPKVEIIGSQNKKYDVSFIDDDTGEVLYSAEIQNNSWCGCNIKYFVNWRILIFDKETHEQLLNKKIKYEDKRVYVWFDSKSIGDTLAWLPVVEEFRKKHKCKVICSTFLTKELGFNFWYDQIEFVEPNTGYDDFDFQYRIAWLEKGEYSPYDRKEVSLQETCAGILGLKDFKEIQPNVVVYKDYQERAFSKPYVTISTQSTAQAKYWNYPGGWDNVVDYIKNKGFDVVCVDKHEVYGIEKHMNTTPNNAIKRHERKLENTVGTMWNSHFHIGLGSGLSWLAWALGKKVILISGFSKPYSEFENCERVFVDSVCNGCYNRHQFDAGDWLWCPDHKDTPRMFECTKSITPEMIYERIDKIIDELPNPFEK